MNALPRYNYPPPPPVRRRAVRRRPRRNPHRVTAIETSFKLGVNAILSLMAVTALIKLVPYNLAQQAKLKEIRAEVSELEGRVDQLQADLNRQFDPHQTMSLMQEESIRVDPRQRQIVWLPASQSTAQLPSSNLPTDAAQNQLSQDQQNTPPSIPPSAANAPDSINPANSSGAIEPAFYPPALSGDPR